MFHKYGGAITAPANGLREVLARVVAVDPAVQVGAEAQLEHDEQRIQEAQAQHHAEERTHVTGRLDAHPADEVRQQDIQCIADAEGQDVARAHAG